MSSPHHRQSVPDSPKGLRIDPTAPSDGHRTLVRSPSGTSDALVPPARVSPTHTRAFENDEEARERQRAMDVDSAMQLSRARSGSIANLNSPHEGHMSESFHGAPGSSGRRLSIPAEDAHFPTLSLAEQEEIRIARGDYAQATPEHEDILPTDLDQHRPGIHPLDLDQDAERLAVDMGLVNNLDSTLHENEVPTMGLDMSDLPRYQPTQYRSHFDFSLMERFATDEKERLGLNSPGTSPHIQLGTSSTGAELRRRLAQAAGATLNGRQLSAPTEAPGYAASADGATENGGPFETSMSSPPNGTTAFAKKRQRKLSQNNTPGRRQGKLAMFEGNATSPPSNLMPSTSHQISFQDPYQPPLHDMAASSSTNIPSFHPSPLAIPNAGHDRPYRFSFYSGALPHTIHARSLGELPAEGQTFEELFVGRGSDSEETRSSSRLSKIPTGAATPATGEGADKLQSKDHLFAKAQAMRSSVFGPGGAPGPSTVATELDGNTWWLDVTCPTDDEMRMLGKVFSIHPLTTEDILMEETREKIELFRNYYFVCFRSFDQDIYSPTHLEPLNMYIIVFREGTLSFHFRGTPHPQSVRRRIKQLKDYINVTSDWISYALIDDITDAFGPLIQSIEYEVDSIDELVLILKETEQNDMLRRIGTCRKKVMGLLRLMGNKADVVKGLAKRCNENWTVAPKSDIGLYLSDIQDHLITMTQNLNHYEKILSRSHSNYLAQISIEMTDANNQINDVLSKLTALGTVLIPMNLVTGLWGMNVHVPGQDIAEGYTWFVSIVGALIGFAIVGGLLTYKLLRSS